jgi:hypothetical protein
MAENVLKKFILGLLLSGSNINKTKMKTKNILRYLLIMAIAGLFLSHPVVASTPASECSSTLWQKSQRTIRFPEYGYKQAIQGKGIVIFTVSNDGKILIKGLCSTYTELGKYIRNVISTAQCPELDNAGIYDFKVIFHFKLI